mgnify:CR=1 FL=1
MVDTNLYPEIGSSIRQYQILDIAGVGGTAIVLKGKDTRTNEVKALKKFSQDKITKDLAKKAVAESQLNIKSDYLVLPLTSNLKRDGIIIKADDILDGSIKKESVLIVPKLTAVDASLLMGSRFIASLKKESFSKVKKELSARLECS